MKISRLTLVPAALLVAVALTACGGGGSSAAELGPSDVAVVGGTQISRNAFDDLMSTAKQSYKTQGRKFPKQGSSDYTTLKGQAVTLLVQQAEREEKAKDLGVAVTEKEIADRLAQIKKQYFGGSEKKYTTQLRKQGLTDRQVRSDIESQLVSQALFDKVAGDVEVSDADVHTYYVKHPKQYKQPQSRPVRHILVKKKALADSIYRQLQSGGDFAALAKKYSIDTGSKAQGGKLTDTKGSLVPSFEKVAFALKTKQISKPVHSQYGWHIIQALGPIKPATTTPEKQVADTIRQQLLQTKKNKVMTTWVNGVEKDYCGGSDVKYQAGFKPSPDPCTKTTTTTSAAATNG